MYPPAGVPTESTAAPVIPFITVPTMRVILAAAALSALIALSGCSTTPIGAIYTNMQISPIVNQAGEAGGELGKSASKSGEACAQGVLALAAWGEASIEAAKKAGGISEVVSVDARSYSILGVYQKYCVIVRGN